MSKKLRWSKAALGEWHGRLADQVDALKKAHDSIQNEPVVAVAARTGSHLDDYPWDWYFTTYGTTLVPDTLRPCKEGSECPNPKIHSRRHAGTVDTLRAAKQAVEENLASASETEGAPAASTPVSPSTSA